MNYDEMSLEELEALRLEKMAAVDVVRNELAAVAEAYDRKARKAELERKLGGLSPEDIELLQGMMPAAQSVGAVGIESSESVGTPGA